MDTKEPSWDTNVNRADGIQYLIIGLYNEFNGILQNETVPDVAFVVCFYIGDEIFIGDVEQSRRLENTWFILLKHWLFRTIKQPLEPVKATTEPKP